MFKTNASFRNIPQGTRLILAITLIEHLLGYFPEFFPLLVSTRERMYWVWTFITAGFYEPNLIMCILNFFSFLLSAKYHEHSWGSREFLKFVFIVNITSILLTHFASEIEYTISFFPRGFDPWVGGFSALLPALTVSFKQTIPEHKVTFFKIFALRVKFLPVFGIFVMLVAFFAGFIHNQLYMGISGTVVSWAYLRFFKYADGNKGDRSDTFSFVSFFPEFIQPLLNPFINAIYKLFLISRIISNVNELGTPYLQDLDSVVSSYGKNDSDAERRRCV
ncbi:hypothetical protein HK099_003838 [Clydaea vesicula]|uniref:Uncharacterized protein n=1 Tax=Clydaea vesicula TaxID=447962 RepID=A0AAD5U150_9FUNG|nr:hypothetical protein HK099_003838 [Clydaea vesicula]